jgi:hypothetical protein
LSSMPVSRSVTTESPDWRAVNRTERTIIAGATNVRYEG